MKRIALAVLLLAAGSVASARAAKTPEPTPTKTPAPIALSEADSLLLERVFSEIETQRIRNDALDAYVRIVQARVASVYGLKEADRWTHDPKGKRLVYEGPKNVSGSATPK